MSELVVVVERLPHARDLPLPAYATPGSAGLDLCAAVPDGKPQILAPGGRLLVPTGIRLALPAGYEAQLRPRSGLALDYGVTLLNAPGTIDSDYRGEIGVLLVNLGERPFAIYRGMRIAQLVIAPVVRATVIEQPIRVDATLRAGGGFGSTGLTAPAAAQPTHHSTVRDTDA